VSIVSKECAVCTGAGGMQIFQHQFRCLTGVSIPCLEPSVPPPTPESKPRPAKSMAIPMVVVPVTSPVVQSKAEMHRWADIHRRAIHGCRHYIPWQNCVWLRIGGRRRIDGVRLLIRCDDGTSGQHCRENDDWNDQALHGNLDAK